MVGRMLEEDARSSEGGVDGGWTQRQSQHCAVWRNRSARVAMRVSSAGTRARAHVRPMVTVITGHYATRPARDVCGSLAAGGGQMWLLK